MKEYLVKHIIDFPKVEEELGIRKAQTFAKGGIKPFVVCFMSPDEYKTRKQNKTFWALIDCFWESGCSSFYSKIEMEEYYYRIANLITIKIKKRLLLSTRQKLYSLIESSNKFYKSETKQIYKLLKGEYEKHQSWSRVKKDKARLTIDTLMHDMDEAGVSTKKYEEILAGMEKDKKFINEMER
jgi:hypothetical protein